MSPGFSQITYFKSSLPELICFFTIICRYLCESPLQRAEKPRLVSRRGGSPGRAQADVCPPCHCPLYLHGPAQRSTPPCGLSARTHAALRRPLTLPPEAHAGSCSAVHRPGRSAETRHLTDGSRQPPGCGSRLLPSSGCISGACAQRVTSGGPRACPTAAGGILWRRVGTGEPMTLGGGTQRVQAGWGAS